MEPPIQENRPVHSLLWNGLESAMLAHFCTDIVLHVLPPLFSGVLGA